MNKPGWFAPGEAERAAKLFGLTFKQFFNKYLTVDYYEGYNNNNDIFVLSPAIKNILYDNFKKTLSFREGMN